MSGDARVSKAVPVRSRQHPVTPRARTQTPGPEVDDRLLKFRTITSIIQAIQQRLKGRFTVDQQTTNLDSQWATAVPSPSDKARQARHKQQLQALSALATLFVREHETVAVAMAQHPTELSFVTCAEKDSEPEPERAEQALAEFGNVFPLSPGEELRVIAVRNPTNPPPRDPTFQKGDHPPRVVRLTKQTTNNKPIQYLLDTWAEQSFEDHVEQVRNLIDQCGKSMGDARTILDYVVGRSIRKMSRRIKPSVKSRSLRFMKAIVELPAEKLQWRTHESPPYNNYDAIFNEFFKHEGKSVAYRQIWGDLVKYRQSGFTLPEDPDHRRILGEIHNQGPESVRDLFPHLKSAGKQHQAVYYTPETYREFHRLLCLSLLGYRASVMALSKLTKAAKPEAHILEHGIFTVQMYLTILHPMAHSRAIVHHFSIVARSNLYSSSDNSAVVDVVDETGNDDDDDEEEEEEEEEGEETEESREDLGDEDTDIIQVGVNPREAHQFSMSEQYTRWFQLQVIYYDAVLTVSRMVRNTLKDRPEGTLITIQTISAPWTGREMLPWRSVVEDVISRVGFLTDSGQPATITDKNDHVMLAFETIEGLDKIEEFFNTKFKDFYGRIHCELCIASLMFALPELLSKSGTQIDSVLLAEIQQMDRAIGVSKRCCPVCSVLLRCLGRDIPSEPIRILGSHRKVTGCTLPPWLPSEVIDKVLELFEQEMGRAFYHLYLLHEEQKKSRSLSGSSTGSAESQPFTDNDEGAGQVFAPSESDWDKFSL